jgi:hypothetical protein
MSALEQPAAGYQAFLRFDNSVLQFVAGSYSLPAPFGLPLIFPIQANGDNIDLAAAINQVIGQQPTQADAVLATLTFAARPNPATTSVAFRPHQPPSRFTLVGGTALGAALVDSPAISVASDALDADEDGHLCDNCPQTPNPDQSDADADNVGDACDLCPGTIPNAPVDADGCPPFNPVDFDRDGDVDSLDRDVFASCRSGPEIPRAHTPDCDRSDLDVDNDIDHDDYGRFQRAYSGTDQLASPP